MDCYGTKRLRVVHHVRITLVWCLLVVFLVYIAFGVLCAASPYFFDIFPDPMIENVVTSYKIINKTYSSTDDDSSWRGYRDQIFVSFEHENEEFVGYIKCENYYLQSLIIDRRLRKCDEIDLLEKFPAYVFSSQLEILKGTKNRCINNRINRITRNHVKVHPPTKYNIIRYYENDFKIRWSKFEISTGRILGCFWILLGFIGIVIYFLYYELQIGKYVSLVKNSEIPKPHINNSKKRKRKKCQKYKKFGRMSLYRGFFIHPKPFRKLQEKYELSFSTDAEERNSRKEKDLFKPNSGYWKAMASSATFKKEKILRIMKARISPFSRVGMIIIVPFMVLCVGAASFAISYYFTVNYSELHIPIVGSFFCGCYFIFFSVQISVSSIVQLVSEFVVITDRRVLYCYKMEIISERLEYLYYDDIKDLWFDEFDKMISFNIKDSLKNELKKFRYLPEWLSCGCKCEIRAKRISIFDYLTKFPRHEVIMVLETMKEAKEKYDKENEEKVVIAKPENIKDIVLECPVEYEEVHLQNTVLNFKGEFI